MFSIKLDTKNLDAFKKRLEKVPDGLFNYVKTGLERKAGEIKEAARDAVPVDTGTLRRSIQYQDKSGKGRIAYVIAPSERYGADVEFGRPPHTPEIVGIARWARRHNLSPWAVVKSIEKKGTKPHPYMKPAFDLISPTVEKDIDDIIKVFFSKYL